MMELRESRRAGGFPMVGRTHRMLFSSSLLRAEEPADSRFASPGDSMGPKILFSPPSIIWMARRSISALLPASDFGREEMVLFVFDRSTPALPTGTITPRR